MIYKITKDTYASYCIMCFFSAIALSKLFLINDPHLQNLTVRGDIVANPEGGIVTRSKAKRSKLI